MPARAHDAAKASYGYATFENGDFGIVNLATGQFAYCGNSGAVLAGLAIGPSNAIYTLDTATNEIFIVSPSNGSLTDVGSSGISGSNFGFGSTLSGIYDLDASANVYSINPSSGKATLIGNTGVPDGANAVAMSTGSKKLYLANDYSLFSLSTKNGKAHSIGTGSAYFGGLAYVKKVLYGIAGPGAAAIYIVDAFTGKTTFVANVQGESANAFGLAPAPATAKNGCSG